MTNQLDMEFEEALSLFEGYVECKSFLDSVHDIAGANMNVFVLHYCLDCDIQIPLIASDPQECGPALCPDCSKVTNSTTLADIHSADESAQRNS